MFYSWVLAIFQHKCQDLPFGWLAEYSPSNPSISWIFLKPPNFIKSRVFFFRQIVRQLVYPLSVCNNLFPFHLWWREIVLNYEKGYKCFVQDCSSYPHLIKTCVFHFGCMSLLFCSRRDKTVFLDGIREIFVRWDEKWVEKSSYCYWPAPRIISWNLCKLWEILYFSMLCQMFLPKTGWLTIIWMWWPHYFLIKVSGVKDYHYEAWELRV